ncbi:hypothetical protein O4H29_06850 [Marinobacter salarius]|uniref:hypothetical protein n=1 Tax=Marinobacter salarius TaxID=1420917 RepID=UPI0022B1BA14|nr:hypothetical protein [Marinobacter salarius]MCZ4284551.1 hypothetical protein [Marinobacter salarius]
MAILESDKPVNLTQREIAVIVAKSITETGLPVPTGRVRNDVNHIQIDPIILEKRVTQPKMGVRLQFVTKDDFKVDFNINIEEFEAYPGGYMTDLFERLGEMLRNGLKMRKNTKLLNSAMYDILTKEAAANG